MPVSPVTATSSASVGEVNPRIPVQTLGQQDFLRLLATQMTSQDPMNPQKDTDFIAQMAQFSSLEQSKTLAAKMGQLESSQQFTQAAALLGRTVQVAAETGIVTGSVTSVQVLDGVPRLVVGGAPYELSQVLVVTESANQSIPTAGSRTTSSP